MSGVARFIRVKGRIVPIFSKLANKLKPGGQRLASRISQVKASKAKATEAFYGAQVASKFKKKTVMDATLWGQAKQGMKQSERNLERLNRLKSKKNKQAAVIAGASTTAVAVGYVGLRKKKK